MNNAQRFSLLRIVFATAILACSHGSFGQNAPPPQEPLGPRAATEIPVDENDPTYPIYKSQAEYTKGDLEAAWALYEKTPDQLIPVIRKLSVPYCLWVVERDVDMQNHDRAMEHIKALVLWSRESADALSVEQVSMLHLAVAELFLQKKQLGPARAWFMRVAKDERHKGTELQFRAILGAVEVDRLEKDFEGAFSKLDRLKGVDGVQLRVRFARAELYHDQSLYDEALEEINWVLKRNPKHPDAITLRGKVEVRIREFDGAIEFEPPGHIQHKIYLGEPVTFTLYDPSPAMAAVVIKVEVRSKLGDRELITLRPVKGEKGKYQTELPTKKGPPKEGDKILQTQVDDVIEYGFSKGTRSIVKDPPADPPNSFIVVANDSALPTTDPRTDPARNTQKTGRSSPDIATAEADAVTAREKGPLSGVLIGCVLVSVLCVGGMLLMLRRNLSNVPGE